ncbi:MAG: hypothetical protein GC172_09595 [Phycisphaera sp.]|nr:hypothetical protein [Phycisphaera sp.]
MLQHAERMMPAFDSDAHRSPFAANGANPSHHGEVARTTDMFASGGVEHMTTQVRHAPSRTAFLTFSCDGRAHWLGHDATRRIIRDQLSADVTQSCIELHAWVLMSNHVHLLVTARTLSVSAWLRRFKQHTAFNIRRHAHICIDADAAAGAFWLHGGGHDRTIWSWQEYWAKVRYIHLNPVRAGLCRRAEDWEWSSAPDFLRLPRAGSPTLSPPPEALVDLLWWKPPA